MTKITHVKNWQTGEALRVERPGNRGIGWAVALVLNGQREDAALERIR